MTERRLFAHNKDRRSSDNTVGLDNYLEKRAKYGLKDRRIANNTDFSRQQSTIPDTSLFFPKGYESIFFGLYLVFLPYIIGLVFLFLYVAEGKLNLFLSIDEKVSSMFTWFIGYEIIAFLLMLYLIKVAFDVLKENQSSEQFEKLQKGI